VVTLNMAWVVDVQELPLPSAPSSYGEEPSVCYRRSCKWLLIWGLPCFYGSNSSFASRFPRVLLSK